MPSSSPSTSLASRTSRLTPSLKLLHRPVLNRGCHIRDHSSRLDRRPRIVAFLHGLLDSLRGERSATSQREATRTDVGLRNSSDQGPKIVFLTLRTWSSGSSGVFPASKIELTSFKRDRRVLPSAAGSRSASEANQVSQLIVIWWRISSLTQL